MKLPKHISASIEHNPHRIGYETVYGYLENLKSLGSVLDFVSESDRERCIETDVLWVVTIYPTSPVGHWDIGGSTLEIILEAISPDLEESSQECGSSEGSNHGD